MARLILEGRELLLKEGESVLDCLLRHDIEVSYGCQAGVCQSCLLQSEGEVPEEAQTGLKDTLRVQNYFLACQCQPSNDLVVRLPVAENFPSEVISVDHLTPEVVRLRLSVPEGFEYRPGQFLNLFHEGQSRSYSLASLPSEAFLEFHVRRVPGGVFSRWIFERLVEGMTVEIGSAGGDCFYVEGQPEQPLLLIATGTGLAPLYGILRDALAHGHVAPIHFYHGSSTEEGLYLQEELKALVHRHGQFHYVPCQSRGPVAEGIAAARANDRALQDLRDLKGWRVFLCGNPEMVTAAQRQCFLAGASVQEIYSDPFLPSSA